MMKRLISLNNVRFFEIVGKIGDWLDMSTGWKGDENMMELVYGEDIWWSGPDSQRRR
jgi:hypothetical protein